MENFKTTDLLTLVFVALLAVFCVAMPSLAKAEGRVNTCEFYTNLPNWSLAEAITFYHENNGKKTIARNDARGAIQACFPSYPALRDMKKAVEAKHGTTTGGIIRKYELFVKSWEKDQTNLIWKRRDLLEKYGEWRITNAIKNAKDARQEVVDRGVNGRIGKVNLAKAVEKREIDIVMNKEAIKTSRSLVKRFTEEKAIWDTNLAKCEFREGLAEARLDPVRSSQEVVDSLCNSPNGFKAEKRFFGGYNISGNGSLGGVGISGIEATIVVGDNGYWKQTSATVKSMANFSPENRKNTEAMATKLLIAANSKGRDPSKDLAWAQEGLEDQLAFEPKDVKYYARGVYFEEYYNKQMTTHDAEILRLENEFKEMVKKVDEEMGPKPKDFSTALADYLESL